MENKKNIHQRILEVYKEVQSIKKTAKIEITSTRSYKAVTHDVVTRALHMPIAKNGIVVIPNQKKCEIQMMEIEKEYNGKVSKNTAYRADVTASIEFVNADDPTQRFSSDATAYAIDSSDKAVGKAYSMAVKMIYLKVFMLESNDEEEKRQSQPLVNNSTFPAQPRPPVKNFAPSQTQR